MSGTNFCQHVWELWFRAKNCWCYSTKIYCQCQNNCYRSTLFTAYLFRYFSQNVRHASRNYAHLKNIKLADPFDGDCKKIDILIGLDLHFKFMTGNIHRGNENESMALESCFGWVVCGYYESPFSTTTNSFTNLRLNTSFMILII